MPIIDCDLSHADAILAILNEAIANSTALYDYQPRTLAMMSDWFAAKRAGNFPIIGEVTDAGDLMGFATYGSFRPFPAYKYTVEHSVYVATPFRGRGVGRTLLTRLIEIATMQEYHVMVGGIDSSNAGSIVLHEKLGFTLVATMPQVGFKFGRWLDLCFYQRVLTTPAKPVEG